MVHASTAPHVGRPEMWVPENVPPGNGCAGPGTRGVGAPPGIRSVLGDLVAAGAVRDVDQLIGEAPAPVLAGLGGPHHWMPGLVEMGRRMAVGAVVAAAAAAAVEALAQVMPGRSDLHARRADIEGRVGFEAGLEMWAMRRGGLHPPDGTRGRAAKPNSRCIDTFTLTLVGGDCLSGDYTFLRAGTGTAPTSPPQPTP